MKLKYEIKLFPIEKNHPPENEIVGLYNKRIIQLK